MARESRRGWPAAAAILTRLLRPVFDTGAKRRPADAYRLIAWRAVGLAPTWISTAARSGATIDVAALTDSRLSMIRGRRMWHGCFVAYTASNCGEAPFVSAIPGCLVADSAAAKPTHLAAPAAGDVPGCLCRSRPVYGRPGGLSGLRVTPAARARRS